MSEADKIMDDSDYICDIFDHIEKNWPDLYHYVVYDKDRTYGTKGLRTCLKKVIQYDGVNTFDGIIKHIAKNEDLHAWWML